MKVVATSFGVCNVFGRIAGIFAPYVAELKPESISKYVFISMVSVAMVFVFLL